MVRYSFDQFILRFFLPKNKKTTALLFRNVVIGQNVYIVKGTRTQDFSELKTTKSHMIQFGFGENFGKIGFNVFVN